MGESVIRGPLSIVEILAMAGSPEPPTAEEMAEGPTLVDMQNLKAEPPARPKLQVTGDADEGQVLLDGVDLTPHLNRLVVDLTAFDCVATLDLAVDVEFDFPTTRVAIGGDPLEDLTAKDLNEILANCPIDSTMGDHLLRHLKELRGPSAQ